MKLNDLGTYMIQLYEQVDEAELQAMSPVEIIVSRTGAATICLTASTDQAGLMGLLSCLHGLGFRFRSMVRVDPDSEQPVKE